MVKGYNSLIWTIPTIDYPKQKWMKSCNWKQWPNMPKQVKKTGEVWILYEPTNWKESIGGVVADA